jgi:hypothetical protein
MRVRCAARLVLAILACIGANAAGSTELAGVGKSAAKELPVGVHGAWKNWGWKVGTSHADVLKLGRKFRLSGIGDGKKNDEWLRLFNHKNEGFYGGFAAGKLWGKTTYVTHLHLGNQWRLSADGKEKDWLRLAPARGAGYFGGFAAGKLHTKKLTVEGEASAHSVNLAGNFLFGQLSKGDSWLRLLNPLTKSAHKKGGLALGNVRASDVAVSSKITTKGLQLGNKWRLSGAGDAIKNDDWLRLMSANGKTFTGGFAASKMMTHNLKVERIATFTGAATFEAATFKGKVKFLKHATFHTLVGTSAQIGNIMLSNKGKKHAKKDWLHVYRADGKSYGGVAMGESWTKRSTTKLLHLGNKWRLSAIGDKYHNDDWLRLMNVGNTGYYGGLAAKKLWTPKAYNHVLQLGTKWRLSGVGDRIKNDNWLRLMDIRNTRLSGGFDAAKLATNDLNVRGIARVKELHVGLYQFKKGVNRLSLYHSNTKKLSGLELGSVKAQQLFVSAAATVSMLKAKKSVQAPFIELKTHLVVSRWRIGLPAVKKGKAQVGPSWLRLSDAKDTNKLESLQMHTLRSTNIIQTKGKATMNRAHIASLESGTSKMKKLEVSGVIHAAKGVWVGTGKSKQKLVPMPSSLVDEVKALRKELNAMKEMMAQMKK